MLGRILHWIYCLPLKDAAVLAFGATVCFFWLRHRFEEKRWWRYSVMGLLGCWVAVVLVQTVVMRHGTGGRTLSLIPFRCYITVLSGGEKELIRSAFMNVLLFYPGGLLLRSLRRQRFLSMVLCFALISVIIELCQYAFGLGTTETDDVIHNTFGAALGILAARQYEKNRIVD